MKLLENTKVTETSLVAESQFTIKSGAKAFKLLSDSLYQDKIGSIVREVICNALDAHIAEKNKTDLVKVELTKNNFIVRDFGPSIPKEKIQDVYCTFFNSTKDEDNESIGCMGLGAKSPFSYTNTFTVETYLAGMKTVYAFFIQDSVPAYKVVAENIPTQEQQGLKVIVPILEKDYSNWHNKITSFLNTTKNDIIFNGAVFEREKFLLSTATFHTFHMPKAQQYYQSSAGRWLGIRMGDVVYPLKLHLLFPHAPSNTVGAEVYKCLGIFYDAALIDVPVGTIEVTNSREDISYTPQTIQNIIYALIQAGKELDQHFNDKVNKDKINRFDIFVYLKEVGLSAGTNSNNIDSWIHRYYPGRLSGSFSWDRVRRTQTSIRKLYFTTTGPYGSEKIGKFIWYQGEGVITISQYYKEDSIILLSTSETKQAWAKFLNIAEDDIIDSAELLAKIKPKIKAKKEEPLYPKGTIRHHKIWRFFKYRIPSFSRYSPFLDQCLVSGIKKTVYKDTKIKYINLDNPEFRLTASRYYPNYYPDLLFSIQRYLELNNVVIPEMVKKGTKPQRFNLVFANAIDVTEDLVKYLKKVLDTEYTFYLYMCRKVIQDPSVHNLSNYTGKDLNQEEKKLFDSIKGFLYNPSVVDYLERINYFDNEYTKDKNDRIEKMRVLFLKLIGHSQLKRKQIILAEDLIRSLNSFISSSKFQVETFEENYKKLKEALEA